jgi:DNA polymerase III subunit epsilon
MILVRRRGQRGAHAHGVFGDRLAEDHEGGGSASVDRLAVPCGVCRSPLFNCWTSVVYLRGQAFPHEMLMHSGTSGTTSSAVRRRRRMSTEWLDGTLYGLDLGTTSPLPAEARLVTASVVIIEPGAQVRNWDWLADPGVEVPAEATEIRSVTTKYAREHGRPAGEVAIEVTKQLIWAWDHGYPVIIFNARYDLTVLDHELIRHGVHRGLEALAVIGPVLDPFVLDRYVDPYRPGSRELNNTCEYYGLSPTKPHITRDDTLAALRLLWKIARRWQRISEATLAELQTVQADVYREWQRSCAKYLRKTVAPKICAEATLLSSDERTAKLAELPEVLARADSADADADGWPLRRAS